MTLYQQFYQVWPDIGIKCSPNVSNSVPKSIQRKKETFVIIAPKVTKYLDSFCKKTCHQTTFFLKNRPNPIPLFLSLPLGARFHFSCRWLERSEQVKISAQQRWHAAGPHLRQRSHPPRQGHPNAAKVQLNSKTVNDVEAFWALHPVWPDLAIFWTLGNLLKPLATINLPKSPNLLRQFL